MNTPILSLINLVNFKVLIIENNFEIDESCYYNDFTYNEYNKKGILIASFGQDKEIELPQGAFYYLEKDKNMFLHNCNTKGGFSGGPIILINNLKIFGIHKGNEKKLKIYNIGIYFQRVLDYIYKYKKNQIEVIIDKDTKKPDIILFNYQENTKILEIISSDYFLLY